MSLLGVVRLGYTLKRLFLHRATPFLLVSMLASPQIEGCGGRGSDRESCRVLVSLTVADQFTVWLVALGTTAEAPTEHAP